MANLTVGQALRILHERGRLALTVGQALRILHERGRLAQPWLPGMATVIGTRGVAVRVGEPDLADPATVGCLAALAREALNSPTAHASPVCLPGRDGWKATFPELGWEPRADTEGAAWGGALVQLARELTV